jgi:hypothetical protein
LFAEAGEGRLNRTVRRGHHVVNIGERHIQIRDQDPLHAGNITFSDDWTLEDLVEYLNHHVFFWPGWQHSPIQSGLNHFARYSKECPIILRAKATDLFTANIATEPLFCRYNSGAPRCIDGYGSPRGPETFLPAAQFHFPPGRVVEVTFRSAVRLPPSCQAAVSLQGPWTPLRDLRL